MLTGRAALVTGGASGIGLAIVKKLAAMGVDVAIGYFSGASASAAEQATSALAAIRGEGRRVVAIDADIRDPAAVTRLYEETFTAFGRLDIAVNCAGIACYKPVIETLDADFDEVFAANARGTFVSMREAARRVADGGRIVSLSSGSARAGAARTAIYAGSKAAIEQFTRTLATELAPRAVTVNAVAPGFTDTDMLRRHLHIPVAMAAQLSPFKRLGEPGDVADIVAFLCTPEARWLTGQTIQAGGGVVMN